MDDRNSWKMEYVEELEKWGKKISKLPDLRVQFASKYAPHLIYAFAWVNTEYRLVTFNQDSVYRGRPDVGCMKSALMHEMGHIFNTRRRGAAIEYKTHEWAMRKCVKLGLENQLWYLKDDLIYWGESYLVTQRMQTNYYYNAFKWAKRKCII